MYRITILMTFIILSLHNINNISCESDDDSGPENTKSLSIDSKISGRMAKAKPGFSSDKLKEKISGGNKLKKVTKLPPKLAQSVKIKMGSKQNIKLKNIVPVLNDPHNTDYGGTAMNMNEKDFEEALKLDQKSKEFASLALKNEKKFDLNFADFGFLNSKEKLKLSKIDKIKFSKIHAELDENASRSRITTNSRIIFPDMPDSKFPNFDFNVHSNGSEIETQTEESKNKLNTETTTEEEDVIFNMTSPIEFVPGQNEQNIVAANTETTSEPLSVDINKFGKDFGTKESKRKSRIKRPLSN